MKTSSLLLLVAFVGFALSSCKKPENEGQLNFSIRNDSAIIQSSPEGIASCADLAAGSTTATSVKKPYFKTQFDYSWAGSKRLIIEKVTVTLRSNYLNGGRFTFTVQGAELNATVCGTTTTCATLGPITSGATGASLCDMRIGGVNLIDPLAPAFMSGVIRMSGVEVDDNNNVNPVSAEASISLSYNGSESTLMFVGEQ